MEELRGSKNTALRSLLANFEGVLAAKEGRFPEAGVFFENALKLDPHNEASLLNLTFLNLKYSYLDKAEFRRIQLPDDEWSQLAHIVSAYLQGKDSELDQYCRNTKKNTPVAQKFCSGVH